MGKSLVFVVGAGASSEVGLPLGYKLRIKIADALTFKEKLGELMQGDKLIYSALKKIHQNGDCDLQSLWAAAARISNAMHQSISIDNFIDSHRQDPSIALCGKIAIAKCILFSEKNSLLAIKRQENDSQLQLDYKALEITWYHALFQLLHENCQWNEFVARLKQVAIVTFNYDRCVEHFLYHAIQNYYGVSEQDAAYAVSQLQIFHPYGKVGGLPWMMEKAKIRYGSETLSRDDLIESARLLRTFTEGIDEEKTNVEELRNSLSDADRLVFLGFSFHKLNLKLLFPNPILRAKKIGGPVYATAQGLSKPNIDSIRQELAGLGVARVEQIHLRDDFKEQSCARLFNEYSRLISLN